VTAVLPAAPHLNSPGTATFRTGTKGAFHLTSTGYPAAAYSETGRLPRGVTMSSAGLISGTPAAGTGGKYSIEVMASNAILPAAKETITVIVNQAPAFTSSRRAAFIIGRAHTAKIIATGFPAARITEKGRLPKGLKFTAGKNGTAVISGDPARTDKHATYVLTLSAANGVGKVAVQQFDLTLH
jgi:large repetitive protein